MEMRLSAAVLRLRCPGICRTHNACFSFSLRGTKTHPRVVAPGVDENHVAPRI